jgi:hypothetical protein
MMKKLYIVPEVEKIELGTLEFISSSQEGLGDDDDWGGARQRGGYYHDDRNSTRNGNQRGNKGWGSLW